jgi:3-dehydroquinate synthetase
MGGGTISDLVGFVAATFSRGVSWLSIPTTFIAQFDCALGGKTAINLKNNKNYCGTFYWPNATFVDTLFLETLPDRFFRAGISEMLKLSIIGNEPLFRQICEVTTASDGIEGVKTNLQQFMTEAMEVKLQLSTRDPYQKSLRMSLLTGHTTAHALEGASKMHLHHGEAVAIGLAFESFVSEEMQMLDAVDRKALVDALEACRLTTVLPGELHDRTLAEHMRLEKRNRGRMISLVLPYKPGKAIEDWPKPHVLLKPDELWSKLVAYRLKCG